MVWRGAAREIKRLGAVRHSHINSAFTEMVGRPLCPSSKQITGMATIKAYICEKQFEKATQVAVDHEMVSVI